MSDDLFRTYTNLPFVGGFLHSVWPVPFGPQGGQGYSVMQAREAMTRAITMARRFAADTGNTGAGRALATVTWGAGLRPDLLLFACSGLCGGMARQVAAMRGETWSAGIPIDPSDVAHVPTITRLMAGGPEVFDYCGALYREVLAGADVEMMRTVALVLSSITALLYDTHARHTGMTALMLADLQLASMPHAFPWDPDPGEPQGSGIHLVTESDAADHAESPVPAPREAAK